MANILNFKHEKGQKTDSNNHKYNNLMILYCW